MIPKPIEKSNETLKINLLNFEFITTREKKIMGYHSYTHFTLPIFLSEKEIEILKSKIHKLNMSLQKWNNPIPETYDEAQEILSKDHECLPFFITEEGIIFSNYNDLELCEVYVQKIAQILLVFLNETDRDTVIKSIGFVTNNRENFENHYFFVGVKISKEKYEIMNLVQWVFGNEKPYRFDENIDIYSY